MEELGVAIIGCGAIHKVHADTVINNPYARLISVVDVNEQKAKAAALKYNCSFYTDYREALKDPGIDVVHICTPHYLHAPMALDAMMNRKHVLTEKPMAISVADAQEMIKVSGETGKSLGVCFQNRYNTTSLRIKRIIESGEVGEILGAKASVTWHRDEKYYTDSGWRGIWDKEGGGVLINQAIHTLDLLQWFMGEIDSLKGNVDTRLLKGVIEVEDTAEATILFKSGAAALFYATNCYRVNSPVELEIVCEKALIKLAGDLTILYENGEEERAADIDTRTGEKSYWGCGHSMLIDDFYKKLIKGKKFGIDGSEGLKALKLVKAVYESSAAGQYIKF